MKRWATGLMMAMVLAALTCCAAAESALDTYATGSFGKKVNLAVYTGPGFEYVRANSGKASYGGGSCRIYGVTGDWVMIGYGLSNGDYRIGYVYRSALNTLTNVKGNINYSLTFQPYTAYADDYCRVTDDPVMNNKMIYTVPQGTAVTVLSTMGSSWTYVEVQTPSGPMRGFVWSKHLYGGNPPAATLRPAPLPTATGAPVYDYYFATPAPTAPAYYYEYITAAPVYDYQYVTAAPVYNYQYTTAAPVYATPVPRPAATPQPIAVQYYVTAAPQATATAHPYQVNTFYGTAAPQASVANTYYHDAASPWLPASQEVSIDGSWPVYSGPGTYYYRANQNRATMGGGLCQVYGVDGDWVLIGYPLSNGNYRMGFISLQALPQTGLRLPRLNLRNTTRRLAFPANLTDDPVRYRPTVVSLPSGAYVLFLGYTGETNETWAYVEVLAEGSIMRGFVPASSLE